MFCLSSILKLQHHICKTHHNTYCLVWLFWYENLLMFSKRASNTHRHPSKHITVQFVAAGFRWKWPRSQWPLVYLTSFHVTFIKVELLSSSCHFLFMPLVSVQEKRQVQSWHLYAKQEARQLSKHINAQSTLTQIKTWFSVRGDHLPELPPTGSGASWPVDLDKSPSTCPPCLYLSIQRSHKSNGTKVHQTLATQSCRRAQSTCDGTHKCHRIHEHALAHASPPCSSCNSLSPDRKENCELCYNGSRKGPCKVSLRCVCVCLCWCASMHELSCRIRGQRATACLR